MLTVLHLVFVITSIKLHVTWPIFTFTFYIHATMQPACEQSTCTVCSIYNFWGLIKTSCKLMLKSRVQQASWFFKMMWHENLVVVTDTLPWQYWLSTISVAFSRVSVSTDHLTMQKEHMMGLWHRTDNPFKSPKPYKCLFSCLSVFVVEVLMHIED